ncbi:MAG: T9SS type A sorting domain-containing protein [Flavobacteriales bacterium]
MKKIYFLLFMLGMGQLFGQAVLNQTIPSVLGANSTLRAPNGLVAHTSIRAHYMLYPAELAALPSGAQITSVGFVYNNGVDVAVSGNIKLYLENSTTTANTKSTTWATAITGMDTLYDGSYAIPVGTTATTSSIVLSDTFTYSGAGIQVAYDYLGSTFATVAANYDCNNSVTGDLKLITSSTTTPGTVLTGTSSWRPGLYIGYINPFTNDMTVDFLVLDAGHINKVYDTTQTIVGTVRNKSQGPLTSVPVTLDISGANPYTSTQTIATLAAGASQTVTFSGISAATGGLQEIKLSVPSDQFTANDSIVLGQSINCDTVSWADNSTPYTAIGFNTGSGILAAKHTGSSAVNSSVKSIYFELDANPNITGNQLQALLLDTGGVIIDSSAIITVAATQLGSRVSMPLTGNNMITTANPDYYIGIRQFANATVGYFPIGSHFPENVPTGRYFGFGIAGGTPSAPYTTLGTLGIGAIIEVETLVLSNSDANDSICPGESVTFTATGTTSSYEFFDGGTSVQSGTSGTYSASLSATSTITAEGTHMTCPILSNANTITVVIVDGSASKTDDSTAVATATGATYQWIDCGTEMAVAGETAQTLIAPSSGSFKVAVTVNGCSDTSSCYTLIKSYAGIEENKIASLKVYPSPATDLLTIETDDTQLSTLVIMDASGKIIFTTSPRNRMANLDISQLPSGIYLLQINTERATEVKRFIKQ